MSNLWDKRKSSNSSQDPAPSQRNGRPQQLSCTLQEPSPSRTSERHKSPATIRRDVERAKQHQLDVLITNCYNTRNRELIELSDELESERRDERAFVKANTWIDNGYPKEPGAVGIVPWKGEKVSMVASKLLSVEVGEVLQRKRGRRVIYVHPSFK